MDETAPLQRFPWDWLAFGLFFLGPLWLPGWWLLDSAVWPDRSLLNGDWFVHGVVAQGVAMSAASVWISWRRRIVVLRYFAPLGLAAACWFWGLQLMWFLFPMP